MPSAITTESRPIARRVAVLVLAAAGAGCAGGPTPGTSLGDPDAPLAACPPRPNCVSSLEGDVAAFTVADSVAATRARLETAIRTGGGRLVATSPTRLRATWRSRLFGFVDDVELVLAPDRSRFDVRSASRVGYTDFGVNRRRVERLHERFVALPD